MSSTDLENGNLSGDIKNEIIFPPSSVSSDASVTETALDDQSNNVATQEIESNSHSTDDDIGKNPVNGSSVKAGINNSKENISNESTALGFNKIIDNANSKGNTDESFDNEGGKNVCSNGSLKITDNDPNGNSNTQVGPSENGQSAEEGTGNEEVWEDLLSSGSIMKLIVKKGKPNYRPQPRDVCVVDLDTYLLDGTLIEKKVDHEIVLGECEVVQGLDLALGLMNAEEICKLKIVPRLAYGNLGYQSLIPPGTTVLYEVHLKEVRPSVDIEMLPISERRKEGQKKRTIGNWWYERREYQLAIQVYRRGLDYLDQVETEPEHGTISDEVLQSILEERIVMYNNMAAAQLKLKLYSPCLKSLETVLLCQPNNSKALYRKAKVFKEQNDIESALKILREALQFNSEPGIKTEIGILEKLLEKQKVKEKDLARKMLGQIMPPIKPKPLKANANNFSNLSVWVTLGSVIIGIIGFITYRMK